MRIIYKTIIFIIAVANLFGNGIWVWDVKDDWERCERIDCDVVSNSGTVRILNVISDDFNGFSLNYRWIWRDEGFQGNMYNFTSHPGCIRIICPTGTSYWCEDIKALKLMQYVDKTKNFEIETCINSWSLYPHEWGNISFFIKDDNYDSIIRFNIGSNNGGIGLEITDICSIIVYSIDSYYPPYPKVYFKISNIYNYPNNNISFSYRKTTATAWTSVYSINKQINNMYIGFTRYDSEPNQWVDIDYFYYYGPVTRRAEINSEIVDLGCAPTGKGTIKWIQNLPDLTTHPVIFYTQTSDDGITWNEEWKGPYTDNNSSEILSSNKRYIRFKGILTTDDERYTPELLKVSIEYPAAAPFSPKITSTVKEDGWTNTNNAIFYFSEAESNGVTVNAYYYAIDGEANTVNSLYTQNTYINVTNIAEGEHILRVIAQADWRNNSLSSSVAEYRFKTDMTPPKKPEVKNTSHKPYEESTNNNFEIELKMEDSKINTENVSGIGGISYRLTREEGEQIDDTIDNTIGKIRVNGIDNGIWYFKVKAIDMAGNTGEELTYCIKINYKGAILSKDRAKIYPNPTAGKFKIWYELSGEAERVKIMIKDSSGRTIKEMDGGKEAGINEIEEEINNLANGVYFVKICVYRKDGKEDVIVKKLVIYKRK